MTDDYNFEPNFDEKGELKSMSLIQEPKNHRHCGYCGCVLPWNIKPYIGEINWFFEGGSGGYYCSDCIKLVLERHPDYDG